MKHIRIWALFTAGAILGALVSNIVFNVEVSQHFIFGFSLGMAFMQGFNYEMNNKGKDE